MSAKEQLNNPTADLESHFPAAEPMLETILDPSSDFWKEYGVLIEDSHRTEHAKGHDHYINATGQSESGADIEVAQVDSELHTRPYIPGEEIIKAEDDSDMTLKDYRNGILIRVSPKKDDPTHFRTVELFVPSDPEGQPEVALPKNIGITDTHEGEKILLPEGGVPEDEGEYNKVLAEVLYYLGDRVVWDPPEGEVIQTQPVKPAGLADV